jgi:hypothetical protein
MNRDLVRSDDRTVGVVTLPGRCRALHATTPSKTLGLTTNFHLVFTLLVDDIVH